MHLTNGQGVNVVYYLKYYLHNPIEFIKITIHTLLGSLSNFISDLFGGKNKWYGTSIDDASFVPVVFFMVYIFCIFKGENKINSRDKIIIGIVLILTYLLISTSLLLTCTPVGYKEIIGIQGRYFIPFLPCIYLIACKNKKDNIRLDYMNYILLITYLYYMLKLFVNYV